MSYSSYYDQCGPKVCTYSFNEPNIFLIIVTAIIGLIGGLNTVSRVLVPWILDLANQLVRKCRTPPTGEDRIAVVWIEQRSLLGRGMPQTYRI